jgi:hypothetical protein
LIDKIGMHSMVIEADMAGNYVGSSWLGNDTRLVKIWIVVLAQRKLEWEQILEESWVKYVATPPQRQRVLMGRSFG